MTPSSSIRQYKLTSHLYDHRQRRGRKVSDPAAEAEIREAEAEVDQTVRVAARVANGNDQEAQITELSEDVMLPGKAAAGRRSN